MNDAQKATALNALNLAYLVLLGMPFGQYRANHQVALASVRDAIANLTSKDAETVQNEYEALASLLASTGINAA